MGSIRCVSYLEDLMVSASEDGTAKLWSISKEKCERTIYGHQGIFYPFIFSFLFLFLFFFLYFYQNVIKY